MAVTLEWLETREYSRGYTTQEAALQTSSWLASSRRLSRLWNSGRRPRRKLSGMKQQSV